MEAQPGQLEKWKCRDIKNIVLNIRNNISNFLFGKGEKMDPKSGSIQRYFTELKVGVFFLIALVILLSSLIFLQKVPFYKGTYTLKIEFNYAEGLRSASPVRYCGVDVGEIQGIKIIEKNNQNIVLISAKIQNHISIPRNSQFFINTLSVFGEKYLEITPPREIDGYYKKEEIVEGVSPVPLFSLITSFSTAIEEIRGFFKNAGELKDSFKGTLNSIETAGNKLSGILDDVKNQRGTIGKLLYEDTLHQKAVELLEEIKKNPWKLLSKPKNYKE